MNEDNEVYITKEKGEYFKEALGNFTRDFAYGGAIRHLVDLGYDTDRIIKEFDYPLKRESIEKMVEDYKKEKGIKSGEPQKAGAIAKKDDGPPQEPDEVMPLLKVDDLTIEFHDREMPDKVVNNVSFDVNEGEIIGIVGESGSGKTMTALAIAGLLSRKDMEKKGEILFDGKNLLTLQRKELRNIQGNDISMIFQEPMTSLNPVKKIGWQIEESLRIHHEEISDEERKKKALALMKETELSEDVYDMYPHELSGGMRQRVMIAAAFMCEPKILLCDEPTTALDVTIQAQIVELLKRLNKEKKTAIIFISHDLSLVKKLCKRVIVMKKGEKVEEGLTKEVFNDPKEEYTKELIAAIPKVVRGEKN